MSEGLGGQARSATKWSLLSEGIAKIIIPVTQLVLARILSPEAFGVVATVVMVSSFAEMLSDAGFQKYLVQHEFGDKNSLFRSASVAFWASFSLALLLFTVLLIFRDSVASLVGSPGLGIPIVIAAISLPISAVVSIQQALFRRAFEYKKMLPVRVVVAVIPLVVSVPLALLGLDYWSLIVGLLVANIYNAIAMSVLSPWKPGKFFSFDILKQMFSFSGWSLLEAISIWMTLWAGTFIVGSLLTSYELGLYRQPILVVNSVFALVTTATTPILFAALSRLQLDLTKLRKFFFQFQFVVAFILFPVGVGAFLYRDFFVEVLFGPQWSDASLMFGAWALSTSFTIVTSHYYSEVFRSLGKPRISFVAQCLYMSVMIPAVYFAALDGFLTLVIVNAAIRVVAVFINQIFVYRIAEIALFRVVQNLYAPFVSAILMGVAATWFVSLAGGHWGWSLLGITASALIYIVASLCFTSTRKLLRKTYSAFRSKISRKLS